MKNMTLTRRFTVAPPYPFVAEAVVLEWYPTSTCPARCRIAQAGVEHKQRASSAQECVVPIYVLDIIRSWVFDATTRMYTTSLCSHSR